MRKNLLNQNKCWVWPLSQLRFLNTDMKLHPPPRPPQKRTNETCNWFQARENKQPVLCLDKFCLQNGLFCLPAVLVKIFYSARNSCSDTLILLEFCSVPEKFSALRARSIFANMEGSLGLSPKYLNVGKK